jgi:hypothetical protein
MSRHALDLCAPATITPKKANCITECFYLILYQAPETFCYVYLYSENTRSEAAAMSKWQNQSYEPRME